MPRLTRVLVVDSDPAIRFLICRELKAIGFRPRELEPSEAVLNCLVEGQFDLALLDIDAVAMDGLEVIRRARELSPVPILALSLRIDEDATVTALDSGADDFLRKPFGTRELLARIRNALRRRAREEGKASRLVIGDLMIDLLHRRVRLHGEEVCLPAKPYEVLRVLAESAGRVLGHETILRAVWGERCVHRVSYLRIAIRDLRRRLEADPAHPRYILTEPRVGYRLEVEASRALPRMRSIARQLHSTPDGRSHRT
jgi:two-component system, OmpR family, KDP operon response regulator KdpE